MADQFLQSNLNSDSTLVQVAPAVPDGTVVTTEPKFVPMTGIDTTDQVKPEATGIGRTQSKSQPLISGAPASYYNTLVGKLFDTMNLTLSPSQAQQITKQSTQPYSQHLEQYGVDYGITGESLNSIKSFEDSIMRNVRNLSLKKQDLAATEADPEGRTHTTMYHQGQPISIVSDEKTGYKSASDEEDKWFNIMSKHFSYQKENAQIPLRP